MIIVGQDRYRVPPESAQRELQEAFPELSYEWMPNSGRWAVVREVPWGEVERLVSQGLLTERDIKHQLQMRYDQGHLSHGNTMKVHAFTVRAPDGGYLEPGSYVIEALKRADVHTRPGDVKKALWETVERVRDRERALERAQQEAIDDAVADHYAQLEWLPRVHMPDNPISRKGSSGTEAESGQGTGS